MVVLNRWWTSFKLLLEYNVKTILGAVAMESVPLLRKANEAHTEYLNGADAARSGVPGTLVSHKLRVLSQKMSREALLAALSVDATMTGVSLQSSLDLF